jgi:glutamate carboxypeptidase
VTSRDAQLAHQIREAARASLPLGRERLRAYIHAESPSGDLGALARCAELVEEGHRVLGGQTDRVASRMGDHLVTSWGPDSSGHLLVIGHYDTVWPLGQSERMPYSDDGDWIAGPGAYDMKGGLVVLEMALRALADTGTTPAVPVRAVVVADEEVGSPTGRAVVEAQLESSVAAVGLEPPHPDGALKSARLGSVRLRVKVRGRESHAALDPAGGVSAVDELLDQLAAIRDLIPADASTLFNIGTISGGTRTNVVAGEAEAEIGIRFASSETEASVLAAIRALPPRRPGAQLDIELLSLRPTWPERGSDAFLGRFRAIGELVGQRVTGRPATGAGDTNLAGSGGVPTLDGLGPIGRGAHALDEGISVESLVQRATLLAALIALGPGRSAA